MACISFFSSVLNYAGKQVKIVDSSGNTVQTIPMSKNVNTWVYIILAAVIPDIDVWNWLSIQGCFGFASMTVLLCSICCSEISPFITRSPPSNYIMLTSSHRTLIELGALSHWVQNSHLKNFVADFLVSQPLQFIALLKFALLSIIKTSHRGSLSVTNPSQLCGHTLSYGKNIWSPEWHVGSSFPSP